LVQRIESWPELTEELRGRLNALRRLRNEFAHHESFRQASQVELKMSVIAAVFALHYLGYIRRMSSPQ
jgi:hypothetical protein